MATRCSILAWRVLWMEKPGRLSSIGSQKVRHDRSGLTTLPIGVGTRLYCLLFSCSIGSDSFATSWTVACQVPLRLSHGISQARILEWVAISFSRGSSRPRDRTCISILQVSCIAGGFCTAEPPGKAHKWKGMPKRNQIFNLVFLLDI